MDIFNTKFKIDAYSDIGNKKKVNQDSLIVKQARTNNIGRVCFACLCDGMGGLSQGEVASASFVNRMGQWFENEFPRIIAVEDATEDLSQANPVTTDLFRQVEAQLEMIVRQMNQGLKQYGSEQGFKLGTTAVVILIMQGQYLIMSVGDSRAYVFNGNSLKQITHDQSYVQQQMDLGMMTPEEAAVSPDKSVLLQCIGASENVYPDFYRGKCEDGDTFLICSDGLWRLLTPKEIVSYGAKTNGLQKMTELVKSRGETDNISGLVIGV